MFPATARADAPDIDQYPADPIDVKTTPCAAIAELPDGPTGKTTCKITQTLSSGYRETVTLVELRSSTESWTRFALVIDRRGDHYISHALDFMETSAALKTDEPKRFLPQLRRARIDTSDAVALDLTIMWSHSIADPNTGKRGPAAMWAQHAFAVYTSDKSGKPVILQTVMGQREAPCRASIDYTGNIAYACEDNLRLTLRQ